MSAFFIGWLSVIMSGVNLLSFEQSQDKRAAHL